MRRSLVLLLSALLLAAACGDDDAGPAQSGDAGSADGTTTTTEPEAEVGMHELQVLGSHNSYHLRPEADVRAGIAAVAGERMARELDYEHRPITEQLEQHGIRQLELDVYADPEGGRFADRPALALLGRPVESGEAALDEPGFKVLHQVDVDFRSSCLTLVACLTEVAEWSSSNPDHEPVMIMIETKQQSVPESMGDQLDPALAVPWTEVLRFDRQTFDALEAEILSVFDRERIITPDDIRGDAATLEEAVLAGDAWPTLDEAAGKVLFALVDTGEAREVYVGDAPALEGRLLFTSSEEGRPDAAFLRIDDPVVEGDRIRAAVEAGYLVRTRTDVPGVDANTGSTERRDAALASGAQYLSTDHYVVDEVLGTGYVVDLPGDEPARCNPVNAPDGCEEALAAA
ncbi:MAG TPA: Ca2+-dependent phosphoinositide-specific phospholipase C [Acidimicrobiales bacterium]|nr:Ca2+-dependent phosphoinositide-specific phospholipase C [Acidimicrobiales bacterium]